MFYIKNLKQFFKKWKEWRECLETAWSKRRILTEAKERGDGHVYKVINRKFFTAKFPAKSGTNTALNNWYLNLKKRESQIIRNPRKKWRERKEAATVSHLGETVTFLLTLKKVKLGWLWRGIRMQKVTSG